VSLKSSKAFIGFYPKLRAGLVAIWGDIFKAGSYANKKMPSLFKKKIKFENLALVENEEIVGKVIEHGNIDSIDRKKAN
jgi:hypothetical protein